MPLLKPSKGNEFTPLGFVVGNQTSALHPYRVEGIFPLLGQSRLSGAGHVPYHYEVFRASQQRAARLPTHLLHTLLDESAIAIHVLGPALQGQRQNCGESGRLFPVDTPG